MSVALVRAANSAAQSGTFTSDIVSFDATGCDFVVAFVSVLGSTPQAASFSATYAGVSMTAVSGSPFGPSSGTSNKIAAFYLANPTTGINNLSVSWSNSQSRLSSAIFGFSGALGTISSIQSSVAGGNLTVASNAGSLVVIGCCRQTQAAESLTTGTTDWSVNTSSFAAAGGHVSGSASVTVGFSPDASNITEVAFNVDVTPSTVNIQGVAGTGSAGTATAQVSNRAPGVSATGIAGTLTTASSAIDIDVSGVSASGQVGSFAIKADIGAVGVAGTSGVGTLVANPGAQISGVLATGAAGSVSKSVSAYPLGASGTGFAGIAVSGKAVTIVGVSATGHANDVFPIPPAPATRPPLLLPVKNGLPASLWLGSTN